ncbi:retinoic acid receptor RXR-alpha isoform X1 [Eptesicus fuscus]|uniref:retinoic acid receptor RXR-alpha isoform X1 n=1 Tax=Eptesicus fuscus TaxID=29078 RepID=UPI0024044EE3|nr:retinoic acid receptor RXR-alpha isoform X1 [Eptesicus fuscus]
MHTLARASPVPPLEAQREGEEGGFLRLCGRGNGGLSRPASGLLHPGEQLPPQLAHGAGLHGCPLAAPLAGARPRRPARLPGTAALAHQRHGPAVLRHQLPHGPPLPVRAHHAHAGLRHRQPAAVQEERQRGKDRGESEVESTSSANEDMPVEKILEAELAVEPKTETYVEASVGLNPSSPNDPVTNICQAADKQLFTLVEWAKRVPHFSELPLDDQVILLRAGWNELLIASFSHRSIAVKDGILLATGLHVHRNSAHSAGVGAIFDRVLTELVSKMRDMHMDKTELGCLRAIVLFNPDSKGLSNPAEVEALREKVYASLEAYCKHKYPEQPGRFAKLLLRLPALRSIGLKCLEHLFFFKLIGDTPIDTFLMEMLEAPHQMT